MSMPHVYYLSLFEHDVLPAPLQPVIMALHTACDMVDNAKATFHRTLASYTSFFTDALVPKMAPPPAKVVSMRQRELDRECPFRATPRAVTGPILAALHRIRNPIVTPEMASRLPHLVGPRAPPVGRPTRTESDRLAREEAAAPPAPVVVTPPRVPDLVVFGPPTVFQSSNNYEADILHYAISRRERLRYSYPRATSPLGLHFEERLDNIMATTESIFVRPNGLLGDIISRMDHYEDLGPREPEDQDLHFCGCGFCPNGIAATRECAFLTIHRSQQRFRRRATASPAGNAAGRWHNACFTSPAFGRCRL